MDLNSEAPKVRKQSSQGQRPWKDRFKIEHQRCVVIAFVIDLLRRVAAQLNAVPPGALPLAILRPRLWCFGIKFLTELT
jgi:hypothetical protein